MVMPVAHFPAPGETVLCKEDYVSSPGGKGSNQAVAAARAGAKVAMVGKVGDDGFGRRSVHNLKQESIWTTGIGISERPTGCATIAVDAHGENLTVVAPGANLDAMSDQVPDEILISKNILLTELDIPPQEAFAVLARARQNGATTILNASPGENVTADALKNVDYLIANEIESQQMAQSLGITDTDPRHLAKTIAQKGNLTCIITLEDRGSVAARGNDLYNISAMKVDVIDTTGAGDAFCGIFAACLQAGHNWLKALHYASVGASLSCLGLGAQDGIPFMDAIEDNLKNAAEPQKI
jgi:ribokinase